MDATSAAARVRRATATTAVAAAATIAVGAVAYEAYRGGWLQNTGRKVRDSLESTQRAVRNVAESAQDAAQTLCTLAKDAKEFLASDAEEVPQSIRQAIKLASCSETAAAVQRHVRAAVSGMSAAPDAPREATSDDASNAGEAATPTTSGRGDAPPQGNNAIFDLALEKLLSDRGADFVSNVASGVARQAIATLLEARGGGSGGDPAASEAEFARYRKLLLSPEGTDLVTRIFSTLIVEATSIYLDKTSHINTVDLMFESATKPQYKPFVEGLCVKLCRVWTETVMDADAQGGGGDASTRRRLEYAHANGTTPDAHHAAVTARGKTQHSLDTPREYPAIQDGRRTNGHTNGDVSPMSVCNGPSAQSSSSSGSPPPPLPPYPPRGASESGGWIGEVLRAAAGDREVGRFLIEVASSSSAATAQVVLDNVVPRWPWRAVSGKGKGMEGARGRSGSGPGQGLGMRDGRGRVQACGGAGNAAALALFVLIVALVYRHVYGQTLFEG